MIDSTWLPGRTMRGAPTEIVEGVWIGDRLDAQAAWNREGWTVIDVREADTEKDPKSVVRIPLLRKSTDYNAGVHALLEITEAIDKARARGNQVLVHCWQGLERSPLSVVCWLTISQGYAFDDAYTLVITRRDAWDRRDWLTKKACRAMGVTPVTSSGLRAALARLDAMNPSLPVGDCESLREGD